MFGSDLFSWPSLRTNWGQLHTIWPNMWLLFSADSAARLSEQIPKMRSRHFWCKYSPTANEIDYISAWKMIFSIIRANSIIGFSENNSTPDKSVKVIKSAIPKSSCSWSINGHSFLLMITTEHVFSSSTVASPKPFLRNAESGITVAWMNGLHLSVSGE